MNRLPVAFSILSALALLLVSCTNDPVSSTGGTETGDAAVVGILYQPDGITPAAGISVAIRPRNTFADTSATGLTKRLTDRAIVITDKSGRFMFDSTLEIGTYVIEAASGNNAVLIDSVAVQNPDTTLELPPDTLRPAGTIKGVVRLSEGGDPRKVFILALGIDRFASADSLGRFSFQNLAQATYDLRIVSLLPDYGVLDTVGVRVVSADTTDLDTLELPFIGIPIVKGLSLSYDTLKQIVTLTWNRADTGLVSGYNVYRSDAGQNFSRITASPLNSRDTMFLDSGVYEGITYEYRVVSQSSTGTESKFVDISNDTITAIGAYVFDSAIENETAFYDPAKMVYNSHTKQFFVVDYNRTGKPKIVVMDENGTTHSEIDAITTGLGDFQVNDLALGKDGSIFIYNSYSMNNQYIVHCSDSGVLLGGPVYIDSIRANLPNTAFSWIMDTDSAGNIWLMNDYISWNEGWLICIDTAGNTLKKWNADSLGEDIVGIHSMFYINKSNNRLFFRSENMLVELDDNGIVHRKISTNPQYVATDKNNLVYAIGSQIRIFSPEGEYLCRFGGIGGNQDSQVNDAAGIAVDEAGRIFVLDSGAKQIKIFTRRPMVILK